jgi:hypothetical protein
MRSPPPPSPLPNPNPSPDVSSSLAPMTPHALQLWHHPPHLLLAEAVASWHPFHKKPYLSDRSTAPASSAHPLTRRPQRRPPRGAASADPSGGSGSASAGAAARARGLCPTAAVTAGDLACALTSISRVAKILSISWILWLLASNVRNYSFSAECCLS